MTIVFSMVVEFQWRPRAESQPPRSFLQTKFRGQSYFHFSSYAYCISTFITIIYVASFSLCTLYRYINIIMCQVIATLFIYGRDISVIKEVYCNGAKRQHFSSGQRIFKSFTNNCRMFFWKYRLTIFNLYYNCCFL